MKKLVTSALLGIALFAGSFQAQAVTNAELKIGISQEFENMNPIVMSMVASTYLYYIANRTLATLSPDGKWVPMLAKEIPTMENKGMKWTADKKAIVMTWEIKENAKWGDGTPVTCNDFKLAWEIGQSPKVATGEKEVWTKVAKFDIDPANPKKCIMTSDKPRWDFNQMPQFYPVPAHLEAAVWEKFKDVNEGYEKNSNFVKNPTNPGLFNGPYMISEVKLGSHVVFVPNPHFYGEKPKFQKVITKLIPNTGTLEANLRSGTIDMVANLGFTFDQSLAFEKKVKAENLPYEVLFKESLVHEHIDMNFDNPILKDLKVRKALVHALNREEMVQALFAGRQKVALHNISPIDPWYTADPKIVTNYKYDKKEAAKLLDEAGWKVNAADGYRYKDGKKLSLQFMTTAGNKTRETVQTFLQGQWKAVGVEVVIKNEPARVYFGETTKKRKYDALAMYAWVSSPENNPKSTYHSKNIPTEANGWAGQNVPGWVNKKADAAMDSIDGEFNHKKRVAAAHTFLKEFTADVPVISLFYRADTSVIPKGMKGYRMAGHQFAETNEIEKWSMQ